MGDCSSSGRVPIEGEAPFTPGAIFYPLVRCRPGVPIRGVCINPALYGVPCHYADGRTVPCVRRWGPCGPCVDGLRQRWYGYLAYLEGMSGRICLVEVTKEAAVGCELLSTAGETLRGRPFTLKRNGESKRARCSLEFSAIVPAKRLPDAIDIRQALSRVWGFIPEGTGSENPNGERGVGNAD